MKETQTTSSGQALGAETAVRPMQGGEAEITHYAVFPGIDMFINNIQGSGEFRERPDPGDAVEINFCTAGRYEQFCGAGAQILLRDGDLSVNRPNPVLKSEHQYGFPTGQYRGIQLLVRPEEAEKWCRANLPAFQVSFSEILDSTMKGRWVRFGKASLQCEHISRELYAVNPHSTLMWLRLKVLELMVALPDGILEQEQEYIPSDRAQLAKHLRDHIIDTEPGEFSLERTAAEHKLSVSQMQRIFKSVYGQPMYQYLKQYRLEEAARVLQSSDASVEEIALAAGYQSSGKFTAAFKSRFGETPLRYRQRKASDRNGTE